MTEQVVENQENGTDLVDEFINNLDRPTETKQPENTEAENKELEENKEGSHIPGSVAASLREDRRALREENSLLRSETAELKGRIDALTEIVAQQRAGGVNGEQPGGEEELSPLEEFERDYPDSSPDAATLIAERKWQEQKAADRAAQAESQTHSEIMSQAVQDARVVMSDERMGQGLGLDSVVGLARQSGLITQIDEHYVCQFGAEAPKELYKIAIQKIRTAGGQPMQELTRRITASKSTNPPKKTNNNDIENPGGEEFEESYNEDVMSFLFR